MAVNKAAEAFEAIDIEVCTGKVMATRRGSDNVEITRCVRALDN
ncbi:hypothetical protein [Nocardia sp. NPDC051833]